MHDPPAADRAPGTAIGIIVGAVAGAAMGLVAAALRIWAGGPPEAALAGAVLGAIAGCVVGWLEDRGSDENS